MWGIATESMPLAPTLLKAAGANDSSSEVADWSW